MSSSAWIDQLHSRSFWPEKLLVWTFKHYDKSCLQVDDCHATLFRNPKLDTFWWTFNGPSNRPSFCFVKCLRMDLRLRLLQHVWVIPQWFLTVCKLSHWPSQLALTVWTFGRFQTVNCMLQKQTWRHHKTGATSSGMSSSHHSIFVWSGICVVSQARIVSSDKQHGSQLTKATYLLCQLLIA